MGNNDELDAIRLEPRRLGATDLLLTPIGFGAFKVGRNVGIKYAHGYDLPTDLQSDRLLHAVVNELGVRYVDTAPAYGLSEERVGRALASREDVVISTKVGESFVDGASRFDYTERAVRESLAQSRSRLGRDSLDLVFVHSDGNDQHVLDETDVVTTLRDAKSRGDARRIGFSGKTASGARAAFAWADAIMVEYHLEDRSHEDVIAEAGRRGLGVIVKKGLASGRLPAREAIAFVLANPHVTSMVIGGLDLAHLREDVRYASITSSAT